MMNEPVITTKACTGEADWMNRVVVIVERGMIELMYP